MPARNLEHYLASQGVNYQCHHHAPAMTASQVARSAHIPGRHMAKTVIVHVDHTLTMAVLPANHYLDPEKLRRSLNARRVQLAREAEFVDRFPFCETGGEPPFGNLYDMPVYVDDTLIHQDWIAFNAGSHTEIITMGMGDFLRLSNAQSSSFAMLH